MVVQSKFEVRELNGAWAMVVQSKFGVIAGYQGMVRF